MIIGQVEGHLKGKIVIPFNTRLITKNYTTKFEFKDESGEYQTFIPQFVIIGHETSIEFNSLGYEGLYLRVTVEHIPQTSDRYVSAGCSSCNTLLDEYRNN